MTKTWFRFYTETLHDPKVRKLPDDLFRAWINLLCVAAKNGGALPEMEEVADELRLTVTDALTVTEALQNLGFINAVTNQHATTFKMNGWEKRQYVSDTSAERMRRYRQRKRDVTGDVTVTPQRQSKKKEKIPKRKSFIPDDWQAEPKHIQAATEKGLALDDAHREAEKFKNWQQQNGSKFADWDAAWRNWLVKAIEFNPKLAEGQNRKSRHHLADVQGFGFG